MPVRDDPGALPDWESCWDTVAIAAAAVVAAPVNGFNPDRYAWIQNLCGFNPGRYPWLQYVYGSIQGDISEFNISMVPNRAGF